MNHRTLLNGAAVCRNALCALLSIAATARATNYYFDASAGSETGLGTQASPWKSLARFKQLKLVAGDSVLLKRATSWVNDSLFITATGSLAKPIVVSDYGNPLLKRPAISAPGRLIVLENSKYVTLENLELSGARGGCVEMWDSTNTAIVVQDMDIHDCGGGIYMTGTNIIARRNFVHNGKMVVNTQATKDDDYGASGINLGQIDGAKIYGNRLVNLRAASYDYGEDGGAIEGWRTIRRSEIYGNFSFQSDGFLEFGGQAGDSVVDLSIHHNIVLDSKVLSCFHVASPQNLFGVGFDNVRLDNNLTVIRASGSWGHFLIASGQPLDRADRIKVRNNIFGSDSSTFLGYQEGGGTDPSFQHSNNLFWMPKYDPFKDGLTRQNGEQYADPNFANANYLAARPVDTVIASFTLKVGSPAIGKGLALGYSTDFLGNPASRTGAVDLGPITYGSVTGAIARAVSTRTNPVQTKISHDRNKLEFLLDVPSRIESRFIDPRGKSMDR